MIFKILPSQRLLFASRALGPLLILLAACSVDEKTTTKGVSSNPEQVAATEAEGSEGVTEPGVYRLADGKLAVNLASHPELAQSVEPFFADQEVNVESSILIVEPVADEQELALGRLGAVDGPVRIEAPATPRATPDLPVTRMDSMSPTRALSPMDPVSPGLRRSPTMQDLQDLDLVQKAMSARRVEAMPAQPVGAIPAQRVGGLHRSPASRSLAEISPELEGQYRRAFRDAPSQVRLSLLPKGE